MKTQFYFNAQVAFQDLYDLVLEYGQLYDGTKALFNVNFTLEKPWMRNISTSWRRWNEEYAHLEYEWYKTGDRNPDMVAKKAKLWDSMRNDAGFVNSNYGYWWKLNGQLDKVIGMLRTKEETRRAIIVHYNPDEIDLYIHDTPCNVVLNFFIVNNKLHLTIFARSVDLVYGFCNDQYCFSRLLTDVASELHIGIGGMSYSITNLHVYERHWDMKIKKFN